MVLKRKGIMITTAPTTSYTSKPAILVLWRSTAFAPNSNCPQNTLLHGNGARRE